MKIETIYSWCVDATKLIKFPPDRDAVQEVHINVNWPKDFYGFTPGGVAFRCDLTALRNRDGYFHFVHAIYGSDYMDNDNVAMRLLTDISCRREVDKDYYLALKIPVTVRLYDETNNLVVEEAIFLRSIGAEEQEKH